MRAARVLDMLLILQRTGRTTARELAETLEVCERTVLRDVEALSEAGAPIFTARGSGGGIELLDGFETRLTGLGPDEARCLFLIGQPHVAHRLGLGAPTRSARNKLLNALTSTLADEAAELSSWFLHDAAPGPATAYRTTSCDASPGASHNVARSSSPSRRSRPSSPTRSASSSKPLRGT